MKKTLTSLAVAVALTQVGSASVSLNFGLGAMYAGTTTNSSFFSAGGLINLLANTNTSAVTWAALAATNGYVSINEMFANTTAGFTPVGTVLLGQLGNDNSGGSGVTGGSFTNLNLAAGYELMAVAYSALTTNSSAPGNGTTGFFFRSATTNEFSIAWIMPADGTYDLNGYTPEYSGFAPAGQFTSGTGAAGGNGFTTVPEPSTYALLAMSTLGLGGYVVRRRNRS